MKLQAFRALGALAMIAGLVWIALRLPGHPGAGAIALACSGLVVAAVGHLWFIGMRRFHANGGAREVLARRDFVATHTFVSWNRDVLIAVDASKRIAICELGKDGVVHVVCITTPAKLTVTAREDGNFLHERETANFVSTGLLTLEITHKKRAFQVVICESFPGLSRRSADYAEYQKIRGVAAWWRDTLSGREPIQAYAVPTLLSVHASAPEVNAASGASARKLPANELPQARVVKRNRD